MKKTIFSFLSMALVILLMGMGVLSTVTYLGIVTEKENGSINGSDVGVEGLPSFITLEMLNAALQEQAAYGYPASVTLAQIIAESGYGRYGPGGEAGQGLSGLAYNYKNLFGMKAPAGDKTPIGVVNMQTGEEVSGQQIQIKAGFLIFANYTDCIRYRSGLIKRVYSDLVGGVTDPNTFARQLGKRWATNSKYGETLIKIMVNSNLYQYDSLKPGELPGGGNNIGGNIDNSVLSNGQKRLLNIALSRETLGAKKGQCQKWVANVYVKAGQKPRQSRACATEAANAWLRSGSKNNIPIGATIYGSHSWNYKTKCGNHQAGHVGIYVGNGLVASREGSVTLKPIDKWIQGYGYRGWGWNGGQDFSKVN